jgi:leucyl aminopeptidase
MKITVSTAAPSQIETECLVVPVLDASAASKNGDKPKPSPQLLSGDKAINDAAAELIASGEITGKMLETTLLHKPAGLKAKRLLLIGGGKAKNFSSYELRKLAGVAVRNLKAKNLKSFVVVAPNLATGVPDAV